MSDRLNLKVPYAEKDEAKSLGARWDRDAKVWYVPDGRDPAPFARWLPEGMPPAAPMDGEGTDSDEQCFRFHAPHFDLLLAPHTCSKCGQAMRVAAIYLEQHQPPATNPQADFWEFEVIPAVPYFVETVSEAAAAEIAAVIDSYRRARDEHLKLDGWFNHCSACGALEGDFFVFEEPGSVLRSAIDQHQLERERIEAPLTLTSRSVLHAPWLNSSLATPSVAPTDEDEQDLLAGAPA